jgi:leucyl aminopeptidase
MIEKKFFYTNNLKNKDIYIFVICSNLKKEMEYIKKKLNIKNIPKKIFNNENPEESKKTLFTDNFEVVFYEIKKNEKCDNSKLYELLGSIGKETSNINNKKILINIYGDENNKIKNQVESYILGYYEFTDFKSDKKINKSKIYFYHPKRKFKKIIEHSIYEANIQNEIRGLINTPANILNSSKYSEYIKKHLDSNVTLKILNKNQLKKIGCNLILGVNQGSLNKPMLIILEYKHNISKKEKPIALIGKGVMFDSGGYNLKTMDFSDMKNDMTGSAIVFGIFKLLSKFKVNGHFIGLLPLVENMIDGNAIRPGDILKSYNGKTVEIVDTDAEGRLIMADALAYSAKFKPSLCIDIATLTGQAGAIFDHKSTIIMGNNNKYIQKMIKEGKENNEKIWELPMWQEYINMTKSNIADFKNHNYESKAGTIMAGAFLSNFIPNNTNWIHLDIAGVDSLKHNSNTRHYGATGEILRTLFSFLQNVEKENYEK